MDMHFFDDVVVILALSIVVIMLCGRFKIPALVGFLLTGVICGPHGLGLVEDPHLVDFLAETGVLFLMFVIGIEFSLEKIGRFKKSIFGAGTLQVLLTTGMVVLGGMAFGIALPKAVFIGFFVSLSSTAIVLSLLGERAESESPYGRLATSMLIFQDLAIVPMMLLVPVLAGAGGPGAVDGKAVSGGIWAFPLFLAKIAGIFLLVYVSSKKIVPVILEMVVRTRNQAIFLATIIGLCFSVAWLTSTMGLSLSLGAFLAGVIISESEYSVHALGGMLPFKEVFVSFFFVSVGMLLDMVFFVSHLPVIIAIALGVMVVKPLGAWIAALVTGHAGRTSLTAALDISQVGEFSFILAGVGMTFGLMEEDGYQYFLAASILTMAATPFVMTHAPGMAQRVAALPWRWLAWFAAPPSHEEEEAPKITDHLIIVGFGLGGKNIARAAEAASIPYVILETNPDTVSRERQKGRSIMYGDATSPEVLAHAGLARARVLAVTVPDPAGVRRVVSTAHTLNPSVHIVARTSFHSEIAPLTDLGASDVVPEDLESSLQLFSRVLSRYMVPHADISAFAAKLRAEGYGLLEEDLPGFKDCPFELGRLGGADLSVLKVATGAYVDGRTLQETSLRRNHGLTVVAVKRNDAMITNPEAGFRMRAPDMVYVFGRHEDLAAKAGLFNMPTTREEPT